MGEIPFSPDDSSVEISDSVVMGDVHQQTNITQVDTRGNNCQICGSSNVVIMKCQQEDCSNSFCEICNRECKMMEGAVVNDNHAPGMRGFNRVAFNKSKGRGPFCTTCVEMMITDRLTMVNHVIEQSRQRVKAHSEMDLKSLIAEQNILLFEMAEAHKWRQKLSLLVAGIFALAWMVWYFQLSSDTLDWCLGIISFPFLLAIFTGLFQWQAAANPTMMHSRITHEEKLRQSICQMPRRWDEIEGDLISIHPELRQSLLNEGLIDQSWKVVLCTPLMATYYRIQREKEARARAVSQYYDNR